MGALRMQGADGTDPTTWAGYAAQLVGAGGLGYLLRELVKRWFQRRDHDDIVAAGLRAEMVRRLEALEKNYAALEERERLTFTKAVKLEAENVQLRRRYHRLINYVQEVVGVIDLHAERLGIPPAERPHIPRWITEGVDGPTATPATEPPREPAS